MKRQIRFGLMALSMLALGLWSCNQNTDKSSTGNDQAQAADAPTGDIGKMESQIMDLHEKTMQDMDSLVVLKKNLKTLASSKPVLTKPDADSTEANIKRLQKADDDMMDWMNQYSEPDKKMAEDKAKAYLTDQLGKIQGVYVEVQRSMKQANDYLKLKK